MSRAPPPAPGGWLEKFTTEGVAYYFNETRDELTWDRPEALLTTEEKSQAKQKLVWVRDEEHSWLPARIVKESKGKATVETVKDGKRGKHSDFVGKLNIGEVVLGVLIFCSIERPIHSA